MLAGCFFGWQIAPDLPFIPEDVHFQMISIAMRSVADTAITPVQDVLGLGPQCRMNMPSTTDGNWRWRMRSEEYGHEGWSRLASMTEETGRAP